MPLRMRAHAAAPPAARHLCAATLCAHFGRFGALTDCFVMADKCTGRPRGFAFVQFADAAVAAAVAMGRRCVQVPCLSRCLRLHLADRSRARAAATPQRRT